MLTPWARFAVSSRYLTTVDWIVTDASGNPVLIRRSGALAYAGINQGDRIIVDPSVRLAIEALPAEGGKDLVLEETPDVTFGRHRRPG